MKLSDFCRMIVIELGECKINERKLEIKKNVLRRFAFSPKDNTFPNIVRPISIRKHVS